MNFPSREAFRETYRGVAEAWEMDSNRHWGTRFFVRSFQTALEWSAAANGDRSGPDLRHRHMIFPREVMEEQAIEIRSARLSETGSDVAHILYNLVTNDPGAICVDVLGSPPATLPVLTESAARLFQPRTLSFEPIGAEDTEKRIAEGRAVVCSRSVVHAPDMDFRNMLQSYVMLAKISEGQSAIWDTIGVDVDELRHRNIGRVLVEMSMTPHAAVRPGDPVEIVAWLERLSGKVFLISYQLNRSDDGTPLWSTRSVGLFLDRDTRRSIPLPADMIAG